jgi:uncharacterized protein YbjT (DUF2867 family)
MQGDLGDHASLVAALKQVDVVISTVGGEAILDGQLKLIAAIKEVGHIKVTPPYLTPSLPAISESGSDRRCLAYVDFHRMCL